MIQNKIGIIQGRLSPRPYPDIQRFPAASWQKEFTYAKEIGYDFIEWIFEDNHFSENPLWSSKGRAEIRRYIQTTGITVESVCADFFLENPFFRRKKYSFDELVELLKTLIINTSEIEAKVILLPVLEKAEIRSSEESDVLIEALQNCVDILEKHNIRIGLETELKAEEYYKLATRIQSKNIGVYYDAGNCAFRGYDMKKDMEILMSQLVQVHVKDRVIGGGSVFLGTGDTNFREGIPYIQKHGYKGNYVLQTYFEDSYLETAAKNLEYMRGLL